MVVRIAGAPPSVRPDPQFYLGSTDEVLMQAFQAGDALAFHALLERHKGMLWKIAGQFFGPRADIDDLVQDLTLTLWQKKNAWQPGLAQFSTWLYKVACNRCIDLSRKKQPLSCDGALPDYIPASSPTAEDQMVHRQQAEEMSRLLKELPDNQRRALQLFYYEEATVPQIAGHLAVTELAARSLLKRGKQNLRGLLTA